MLTNYIGIDVAARSFVSARQLPTGRYQLQTWPYQTPQHLADFVATLSATTDHCVLEATGNYHLRLAHALVAAGIAVSVVNPLSVKRFGQMLASITKTDARDAVLLARFGQQQRPKPYQLPTQAQQQLTQRRTALSQLVQQRQALSNQLHALCMHPNPDGFTRQLLLNQQTSLDGAIAQLQDQINLLLTEHYSQATNLLASIPGFGPASITAFLSALAGFSGWQEADSTKAFIKYMGLAPVIHESGRSVRGGSHISRSAIPWLRQTLWLPSCTLVTRLKRHTVFRAVYDRLRANGKSFKEALIGVMHKLVRVALGVLRSGKAFENDFQRPTKGNLATAL